ncbi:response regulator transcription factor [Sporosalibacterium faouarense]|uniref:response regulator transcription factor n=1 Tax=Sporosalibacterium faouarense TaxID=516123 RepID=UPI00141D5402|nr:response regulator transcription factor [Sporosalibacterium faouarense]MTI47620.1 response regulator transcription factor [Bacillota bacterium]
MYKILVIDDEVAVRDLLSMVLKREGYKVETAIDGYSGLALVDSYEPDLVLLDLMLPDIDGHEICKKIHKNHDLPTIMLTAKTETIDKVLGLEFGADDYITKPFDNRELLARIKALLRRSNKEKERRNNTDIVKYSDIAINFPNKTVKKNNEVISLTPREFQLLEVIAKNQNKVFSRDELMEKAWGYDYAGDSRAVDIYITRLRKKIEDDSNEPKYIITVYGFGYRFGNK